MSIKKSLRILLFISSIMPVLLVCITSNSIFRQRLTAIQAENLKRLAESSRSGLEAMLETQRAEISNLSHENNLQSFAKINNKIGQISSSAVNSFLTEKKGSNNYIESITLYNKNDIAIASSDPFVITKNFSNDTTLSYLHDAKRLAIGINGVKPILKNNELIYTIDIGYPLFENGAKDKNIIGCIICTMRLSYYSNLLNSIRISNTGYGILINQSGTILYHNNSSKIGSNIYMEQFSNIIRDYNDGLVSQNGNLKLTYNKVRQVYGYSVIPEFNWLLLVKQDTSEILSLTKIILPLLLLISAFIFGINIFFSYYFARKLSDPIIALRDAMRTASDGNLNVQTDIRGKNEFGELSKSFNKMIHIVKTNYEDLEAMHEELLSNEEQLRSNYDHIEYLAYHDTLTNLPNKLAFLDYVNTALTVSKGLKKTHAVYFIDMDNFKNVNDSLGHEYGDALLVKTAQILTSFTEGTGMLARVGGDEFLIFKENAGTKKEALNFASKIIDYFRNPLDIKGEAIYVSMSVGIAIYPDNGIFSNILIKNADIAMYKSKESGKNRFTLFNKKMEEELNRNTLITEILRNAIDNKEIYIQYQPLFDLKTNTINSFEALMRIYNDRLGSIAPDEFIPVAEESGLIMELSSWLLKEVCNFNMELIRNEITPRPVSVNISSVQINSPGFITLLSGILEETGLPPRYLELEITESSLISSIMDATTLLSSIQNLGVKVSLDDFGTGYSSLNYLTRLPIDILKIDKSFIDHICTNKKDSCITDAIIKLAHSLNIKVVAEGVEHKDQLDLLKLQNCDIIQGFIYSGPIYQSELVDLLKTV